MDYKNMTDAEVGVLANTWGWRLKKAGYKNAKAFCDAHNIPDPQFSLWVNGKAQPMPHNVKKVEEALKESEEAINAESK